MSARSYSLGGLEDGAPHYFHSMRAMGDWRRAASTGGHSSKSEQHQHQEINIRDEQGISIGRRKRRKNGGEKGSHHGGEGGRRIVVGMKLTAACREVLTWTIAKLAHPGDHVVALHVSSFPGRGGHMPSNFVLSIHVRVWFSFPAAEFFFDRLGVEEDRIQSPQETRLWVMGCWLCSSGALWVRNFEAPEIIVGVEDKTRTIKELGYGSWNMKFGVPGIIVGVKASIKTPKKLGSGLWV